MSLQHARFSLVRGFRSGARTLAFLCAVLPSSAAPQQQPPTPPVNPFCADCPPITGIAIGGAPGWPVTPICANPFQHGCHFGPQTSGYLDGVAAMTNAGMDPNGGVQDGACVFHCWTQSDEPTTGGAVPPVQHSTVVIRIPPNTSCSGTGAGGTCVFVMQTVWIDNNNDGHHHLDSADGTNPGGPPPESDNPLGSPGTNNPLNDDDSDGWPNGVDPRKDVPQFDESGHPNHGSPVFPPNFWQQNDPVYRQGVLESELGVDLTGVDMSTLNYTDYNSDGYLSLAEVGAALENWANDKALTIGASLYYGSMTETAARDQLEQLRTISEALHAVVNSTYGNDGAYHAFLTYMTSAKKMFDKLIDSRIATLSASGCASFGPGPQDCTLGTSAAPTFKATQAWAETALHPDAVFGSQLVYKDPTGVVYVLGLEGFEQYLRGTHNEVTTGDPVDTARGEFVYSTTDLRWNGRGLGFGIQRNYRSRDVRAGIFGPNWSAPLLETHALWWPARNGKRMIQVFWGDGNSSLYRELATSDPNDQMWEGTNGSFGRIRSIPAGPATYGCTTDPLAALGVELRQPDGTVYSFCPPTIRPGSGHVAVSYLRKIRDPQGNTIQFKRNAVGHVTEVRDTLGGIVRLEYDDQDLRVERIRDWADRVIDYTYDPLTGDLIHVDYPETEYLNDSDAIALGRPSESYEYEQHPMGYAANPDLTLNHNLSAIRNATGQAVVEVEYETSPGFSFDRVKTSTADGAVTRFSYQTVTPGVDLDPRITQLTTARYADGEVERFYHGKGLLYRHERADGLYSDTFALIPGSQTPGAPSAWVTKFDYNNDGLVVDEWHTTTGESPAVRRIARTFDSTNSSRMAQANVLQVAQYNSVAAGVPAVLAENFEYEPVTNQVVRSYDALGQETTTIYGHQESSYADALQLDIVLGWNLLPATPADPTLWGLGDRNQDGVLGGTLQAISRVSPQVERADGSGPGGTVQLDYSLVRLAQYDAFGQLTHARDAGGAWTHNVYSNGLLTSSDTVAGAESSQVAHTYDALRRLKTTQSSAEPKLEFGYDSRDNVVTTIRHAMSSTSGTTVPVGERIVDSYFFDLTGRPAGRAATFKCTYMPASVVGTSPVLLDRVSYTAAGLPSSRTERVVADLQTPQVATWTFEHDGRGRPRSIQNPLGLLRTASRDSRGLVKQIDTFDPYDGTTGVESYEYDEFDHLLSIRSPVDSDGNGVADTTTFTYDGHGRLATRTSPTGIKERRDLDALGRVERLRIDDASGVTADERLFGYDALSRLKTLVMPHKALLANGAISAALPATIEHRYGYGDRIDERLWTATTVAGGMRLARYGYDALGRATSEHFGATDDVGRINTLDDAGRAQSVIETLDGANRPGPVSPSQTTTALTYDAYGRPSTLLDATSALETYEYDEYDRVTRRLDASGREERYVRDSTGRMIRFVETSPSALTRESSTTYDLESRILTQTDSLGRVTRYEWDGRGNLRKQTYPDSRFTTYQYDLANRLTLVAESDGTNTVLTYDGNGAVSTINATGGDAAVSRTYEYNALGVARRITEQVAGQSATVLNRTVSSRGWLVREILTGPAGSSTAAYAYDGGGALTAITYPSGRSASRTYDSLGRVQSIASSVGGNLITFSEPYGFQQPRRGLLSSGATVEQEYDAVGRALSKVTRGPGGSILHGTTQSFGSTGALQSRSRMEDSRLESVVEDAFRRLEQWRTVNQPSGVTTRQVDWIWNKTDTLTKRTDTASPTLTVTPNALNQLRSALPTWSAFVHRFSGEESTRTRAAGGGLAWKWDAFHRPLSCVVSNASGVVETITWAHDGLDRMIRRSSSLGETIDYRYIGEAVLTSSSTIHGMREYVPGAEIDEPLWRFRAPGETRYLHVGPFGNVEALHDGSSVVEAYDYDPFGLPRDAATGSTSTLASSTNDLYFLGKPHDFALGMTRLGARMYDNDLGRFVSRDPLGTSGGSNLYSYAFQNPFRWADPSGLSGQSTSKPTASATSVPKTTAVVILPTRLDVLRGVELSDFGLSTKVGIGSLMVTEGVDGLDVLRVREGPYQLWTGGESFHGRRGRSGATMAAARPGGGFTILDTVPEDVRRNTDLWGREKWRTKSNELAWRHGLGSDAPWHFHPYGTELRPESIARGEFVRLVAGRTTRYGIRVVGIVGTAKDVYTVGKEIAEGDAIGAAVEVSHITEAAVGGAVGGGLMLLVTESVVLTAGATIAGAAAVPIVIEQLVEPEVRDGVDTLQSVLQCFQGANHGDPGASRYFRYNR